MLKKILSASQIREWDQYTLVHEPVSSLALMERAAARALHAISHDFPSILLAGTLVNIYCGQGNNGGDGLVIARLLQQQGVKVKVFLLQTRPQGTPDFELNLQRFEGTVHIISEDSVSFPPAHFHIEALFGSGLNKALEGLARQCVLVLNEMDGIKISIDIPAGLPANIDTALELCHETVFRANHTYTFQRPKQSFLFPETGIYAGKLHVVEIDLHAGYEATANTNWYWKDLDTHVIPTHAFIHKGTRGHACLIGGSLGKAGAVLLSSKAALATGAGRVTAVIPKGLVNIIQTALPEAMCMPQDGTDQLHNLSSPEGFDAVGIGPGMGQNILTRTALKDYLLRCNVPVVLDADALNICAELMKEDSSFCFPQQAILTPHPKEFERLFGPVANSLGRLQKAIAMAKQYNVVLVLKGAFTAVVSPDNMVSFNASGNTLLATAGSGDVLTGVITALLAQGLTPYEAACKGVYLHGKAADLLAAQGYKHILAQQLTAQLQML